MSKSKTRRGNLEGLLLTINGEQERGLALGGDGEGG